MTSKITPWATSFCMHGTKHCKSTDICATVSTAVGKEACNCFTCIGSKCVADLKFHPYKIQVVQFLLDHGKTVHLEFCHCIRKLITEYPTFVNNFVMSEDAHFHVNGSVNKQNM